MFRINVAVMFYVTPDWYFSSGVKNHFVLRAYQTMRVKLGLLNIKYVVCIGEVSLQVVGPNL